MPLQHARAVMQSKDSGGAWDYIREHPAAFLWSDDEDWVNWWNSEADREAPVILVATLDYPDLELKLGSFTKRVRLSGTREDNLVILHSLAQCAKEISELRVCTDSLHSSDVAFMALRPSAWTTLAREFSVDEIDRRFLSIAASFDAFKQSLSPPPAPGTGRLGAEMIDWEGGPSYKPETLDWVILADGPGQIRYPALGSLIDRIFESDPVRFGLFGSSDRSEVSRPQLVAAIAPFLGKKEIRISNISNTAFLIISKGGAGSGWRTDRRSPSE